MDMIGAIIVLIAGLIALLVVRQSLKDPISGAWGISLAAVIAITFAIIAAGVLLRWGWELAV